MRMSNNYSMALGLMLLSTSVWAVGQVAEPDKVNVASGYNVRDTGDVTRADVTQYPYMAGGKLIIETGGGATSHCTAQFVCGSTFHQNDNVVLMTAAHCVDGDKKNFLFRQQYQNGTSTASIPIIKIFIPPQWGKETPYSKWDYAFLVASRPSVNATCVKLDTTHYQGEVTAIGYPISFDKGEYMQKIITEKTEHADGTAGVSYDMTGAGSSGGAWLRQIQGGGYAAVGLKSATGSGGPDDGVGPVFDENVQKLWTQAYNWKHEVAAIIATTILLK